MSMTHRLSAAAAALFAALVIVLGGLAAGAQERAIAKVNGKTITDTDMKLAEAEIGNDLGSLPEATKRRVLRGVPDREPALRRRGRGPEAGRGPRLR